MKIEIKLLDPRLDGLGYATPGAAGVDLRACRVMQGDEMLPLTGAFRVMPGEVVKVGTGVAAHIGSVSSDMIPLVSRENGYSLAGMLMPRSGLGTKHRIRLANTVGLVDDDYQGELILAVENGGSEAFVINPLDRLAQMVIVPVIQPSYVVVDEFVGATSRGTGGFGSTGVGG